MPHRHSIALLFVLAATLAGAGTAGGRELPPLSTGPLATGLIDDPTVFLAQGPGGFAAARSVGASSVRLIVRWNTVAPYGTSGSPRPAGFNPQDPADPLYSWADLDTLVRQSVEAGLEPILSFDNAPGWAESGTVGAPGTRRPSPTELANFATAAARRYSGSFEGLPRVRHWLAWNEPNLDWFLMPQFEGATPFAPSHYREMLNAFSDAVHAVHADNVVAAGAMTPFGDGTRAMWPLHFMRELLCVSSGANPVATCSTTVRFDVWAHQPYSNGNPLWEAPHPDGGSLGDLPEMRRMLEAAIRAGHVSSSQRIRFWVTEFSWDTSPPDPQAVPPDLHARWVAEAMYRMWRNGVSLVTWFTLRDSPYPASTFQSGLYYADSTPHGLTLPKPALSAFRFPFVAIPERGRVTVWGRTPSSERALVGIEGLVGGSWKPVVKLRANRYGIFMGRVRTSVGATEYRARVSVTTDISAPFAVAPPANNGLVLLTPFGTP